MYFDFLFRQIISSSDRSPGPPLIQSPGTAVQLYPPILMQVLNHGCWGAIIIAVFHLENKFPYAHVDDFSPKDR